MSTSVTNIEVIIDVTAAGVKLFETVSHIEINKAELFKYAVMQLEVPPHVDESDFAYLQSKVPAIEAIQSEFIDFSNDTIYNLSNDDRNITAISELVGVALGLKYSTLILNTNPNKFKKIGKPVEGKYLDYSTVLDSKEYEIETKGTIKKHHSAMKNDIINKKNNTSLKAVHLRYGVISKLKRNGEPGKSKCIIVDDPPQDIVPSEDETFKTQLWAYASFLSYILDSKYYNKYVKPLAKNQLRSVRINNRKFFTKYSFNGNLYYGECFDYRLIKDNVNAVENEENAFGMLTSRVGKVKFFIGIEEILINAINKRDSKFLALYNSESTFIQDSRSYMYLDKDGILIVKSVDGENKQLEELFPENEVKQRLKLYTNFLKHLSHKCGAPCQTKSIYGKPCEKLTYRKHCHYHR